MVNGILAEERVVRRPLLLFDHAELVLHPDVLNVVAQENIKDESLPVSSIRGGSSCQVVDLVVLNEDFHDVECIASEHLISIGAQCAL
jgi:predicted ATP-dependent endonuclease of OLD family